MKKNKNRIIKILKFALFVFAASIVSLLILLGIHIYKRFGFDPKGWMEYIRSFGAYSGLVLYLFQLLQVFIAIIPGEVIEIVAGLLFNPFIACLIVYLGMCSATLLIFALVKKMGRRFSRIFVSEQKLRSLRFINTKDKLKKTAFVLFLIPGTPKDLLTYFFALTPVKLSDFMFISSIARFPSVISSVIGGRFISKGEYLKAVILFIITAVISVIGVVLYEILKKRWENRRILRNIKIKRKTIKLRIIPRIKYKKTSKIDFKKLLNKVRLRKRKKNIWFIINFGVQKKWAKTKNEYKKKRN